MKCSLLIIIFKQILLLLKILIPTQIYLTVWPYSKNSSSSTRLFNCKTHDQSIRKLDRNSSLDMYIASCIILSQLLFHCLYAPRKQYLEAFNTAKSANMIWSMSSYKLSSSSKQRRMKAFLTRCSASSSHSLIEIALLVSLGILEGFFHMRWVRSRNKEKNTFLLTLRVLGRSKLLDFDGWSRKFPRMDSLDRKNLDVR